MDLEKETKVKRRLICPIIWAIISTSLFLVSLIIDYQHEAIKEHVRFRKGFPSRTAWENPPDGTLRCYIFNVTNSEAFLNGTDKKLHLQQVGPIVYRIKIGNTDLIDDEENSTLTFRKLRRRELVFDEENSPPGIMDQKVYIPNVVLLSIAAKLHNWFYMARNAFNIYAKNEPIFVHHTVYEVLWNYTTPLIDNARPWLPGVLDNVGTLYNAFRETKEVYTVNIGLQNGLENFFKIRTLNNLTVFEKQLDKEYSDPEDCPVHVVNAFDNTVFPPYMKREDRFSIVAGDSCRTLPMKYEHDIDENGLKGYKFVVDKDSESSCLKDSMDIPLPNGIFDVSSCRYDVPSTYSQPHFFGSSYNFEEHFEGISPNAAEHQTFIWIEPQTGIPFEEKYRFQQSIPIPEHLNGFSEGIRRFNGMVVPTFWYEYDLDDLPFHSAFMLKATAVYMPTFQKFCTVMFLLATVVSLTTIIFRVYGSNPKEVLWFGQREMQQTIISEVPTNFKNEDGSESFLPRNVIKV